MLPIRGIFFPLKVAPMRIKINFKGHQFENPPKLSYANMSAFLNLPNFDATNIKWFSVSSTEACNKYSKVKF